MAKNKSKLSFKTAMSLTGLLATFSVLSIVTLVDNSSVNAQAYVQSSLNSALQSAEASQTQKAPQSARVRATNAATQAVTQAIQSVTCPVDRNDMTVQDNAKYSGQVIEVKVPEKVAPDQLFEINIRIKNTGTTPWYSFNSQCEGQNYLFLGTDNQQDRLSPFHAPGIFGNTGWYDGNRIKMNSLKVASGEIADFIFTAKAPSEAGVYREFFSPVIEGVAWIKDSATASFDLQVGEPEIDQALLEITKQLPVSMNLLNADLKGEKKFLVDISEQKMYVQLNGVTIKTFPVSTGTSRTPTPFGTMKISLKQEVRVGYAYPHYIMPKFMMFKQGGYGIHALPSLANDKGVFWREALNHIGTRRSHGCIRLLPEDAEFAFNFAEIGTIVQVIP